MKWITIDNIGFSVPSVQAMSEKEFAEQYKDHRPLHLTDDAWQKWCKDAYGVIMGIGKQDQAKKNGKPEKPKNEKPAQ